MKISRLILGVFLGGLILGLIGGSGNAYFGGQTKVAGNRITTGSWETEPAEIICGLETIYARAGEPVNFFDIACADEPALEEVFWDLDQRDGINWEEPDLSGNAAILAEGYLRPGSYTATVWARNAEGLAAEREFWVEVENPALEEGDLKINELIPNPVGDDEALAPAGEWIKLSNELEEAVDLAGFVFYDSHWGHDLPVTAANCEDSSTLIEPGAEKKIYRNGDPDFSLNNEGSELVRLMDGFWENGGRELARAEYEGEIEADEVIGF